LLKISETISVGVLPYIINFRNLIGLCSDNEGLKKGRIIRRTKEVKTKPAVYETYGEIISWGIWYKKWELLAVSIIAYAIA
tara:strand:+ start:14 stop:256 length:243 start_codon:yes stop_codon:yes gene_type:complete